jgi:hypothetical protein
VPFSEMAWAQHSVVGCSIVEPADRIDVDAIAREGLDQHERTVVGHGACRVPSGIDRPAHVVQAIEEADQIVVILRVVIGLQDLEGHTIVDAGILGYLSGCGNRPLMNVEPPEPARRIGLGHQDGRVAVTTPDVGHSSASGEFLGDAHQRRQPFLTRLPL